MEEKINKENMLNIESGEDSERIIPVIREEIVTGRKVVKKATIQIKKTVNTEEVDVDIPLESEHYDIEHIPINKYLDSRPEIRHEGETTVIPVIKEVFVKRLLLTEEIRITRKITITEKTGTINLKKEEVEIIRKENQEGLNNED